MPRRRAPRKPLSEELWNVPNILTYGRIVLVPFVMWFLARSGAEGVSEHDARVAAFTACVLFSLAAVTDFLDGWVARNWDLGTMVGRFLDPLADKIIVMASLVMLVELQRISAWFVVLLISRELSITSLRSIATSEGFEVPVEQAGKWKTAFQLCGLVGLLTHFPYPVHFGLGIPVVVIDFNVVGTWLLGLSMFFSVFSAVQYFFGFAAAAARRHDEDKAAPDA